jgi:hypothetical protein
MKEHAIMSIPVRKNKSWFASVQEGIGRLGKEAQCEIMEPAGRRCAGDLLALCEEEIGRPVESVSDLVSAWNGLREKRNLSGRWSIRANMVKGKFLECGCPLVRSGLIALHPTQCLCSKGMMETVFSMVSDGPVKVDVERSLGRGDDVCEFSVEMQGRGN